MSQNTGQHSLSTSSSSLASSNNQRRILSHPQLLPNSSNFNTPSTILSSSQNESPSAQSHTSPIVNDVCASGPNGVRNPSATLKIKDGSSPNDNHFNDKYSFTLDLTPPVAKTKKDYNRKLKSQLYPFDMQGNNEEDLRSPFELDVPVCENPSLKRIQNEFLIDRMLKDDSNSSFTSQPRTINQSSYTNVANHGSPLLTPSSDHHDIDALSDAGTYIIEDDIDIGQDDEPEQDSEQQSDLQEKNSPQSTSKPSSFKRYAASKRNRHGTFDLQGVSPKLSQSVTRPIVDLSVPAPGLSSPSSSSSSSSSPEKNGSSSSSSLLSLPTESDSSLRKEPEGASHQTIDDKSSTGLIYARQRPTNLLPSQQKRPITPPQNQIKPAESFVISPTFETKPFPNITSNASRRKLDIQPKPKSATPAATNKEIIFEIPPKNSPSSPPLSARSNLSDTEKFSFRLQQQSTRSQDSKQQSSSTVKSSLQSGDFAPLSSRSSLRPHTMINDQAHLSPFQRNSSIRQTMPANTQYNRAPATAAGLTTPKYVVDDNDEVLSSHPSLTKVYMNKSFALRRQRSNLTPSTTTKPVQQQTASKPLPTRPTVKPTTSVPTTSVTSTSSAINSSSGQTNRAVELRRARAQAKIEELAQRTRQQLQKTEQYNDVMSASWHSNASSSSRKDFSHLRANPRSFNTNNNVQSQKQDLLQTRTISSSSSHHRSSSASPNPLSETTSKISKYRKPMVSSVTSESQYQKMNGSTYSEGERCDSLRDDGQRLAIKLIQLSSGILAKLKPNNVSGDNDSNVHELEHLVDQLQTVNRTLSNIDASLTGITSDENLL